MAHQIAQRAGVRRRRAQELRAEVIRAAGPGDRLTPQHLHGVAEFLAAECNPQDRHGADVDRGVRLQEAAARAEIEDAHAELLGQRRQLAVLELRPIESVNHRRLDFAGLAGGRSSPARCASTAFNCSRWRILPATIAGRLSTTHTAMAAALPAPAGSSVSSSPCAAGSPLIATNSSVAPRYIVASRSTRSVPSAFTSPNL